MAYLLLGALLSTARAETRTEQLWPGESFIVGSTTIYALYWGCTPIGRGR